MAHPTFLPRGVFVPTHLIFHPELPSAVLVTWIQLRSLAWDSWTTPPMSLPELAAHIGIHHSRLNKHLAQLKDISALSWRNTDYGKIIISFPEEPTAMPENQLEAQNNVGSTIGNTSDRETPIPHSFFPQKILGYLSFEDDEEGALYGGEYSAAIDGVNAEQARELSNLTICKPAVHAFLAK